MIASPRILVTGATGMVGGRLVQRLSAEGRLLTLTLRRPTAHFQESTALRIVSTGDLETSDRLDEAMDGVDRIVHCAGHAHVTNDAKEPGRSPAVRANADATARLCEAADRKGVATFVHLSSVAAIAGNWSHDILTDADEPRPVSEYGRSKRQAERHVAGLAGPGRLAVSMRPPLVLGAKARGNLALLRRVAKLPVPLPFASLDAKRSLIGLDTLVDAIIACLDATEREGRSGAYLVADRDPLSLAEMLAELRAGMGRRPRLLPLSEPIFSLAGRLLGRNSQVDAMTRPLLVDGSRFEHAFTFTPKASARKALRSIGREIMSAER